MIYSAFSGTLNPTQSINHSITRLLSISSITVDTHLCARGVNVLWGYDIIFLRKLPSISNDVNNSLRCAIRSLLPAGEI